MSEGITLFLAHYNAKNRIGVLIDCDLDGMASAAMLKNYCLAVHQETELPIPFPKPNFIFFYHEGKIHGLSDKKVMEQIKAANIDLLIIPDASGTTEQYAELMQRGISILVLDHHDTKERGDGKTLVVINNQQSENYKNKALSGVGVVWQFCRALESTLQIKREEPIWSRFMDLLAIGLVCDVMDLRSPETFFLVHEGLATDHSSLIRYMRFANAYSLGDKWNPERVGFCIGPIFNAVTRIGTMLDKQAIFTAMLDDKADEKVADGTRGHQGQEVALYVEAYRLANNARSRQTRQRNKLTALVDGVIAEEKLFNDKVIAVAIEDFDDSQRALSGLIANQLIDIYERPVVLVFKNPNGTYSGSLRAPSNITAYNNFKDQCEASNKVQSVAGHQQAAGIAFTSLQQIVEFRKYFNEKYETVSTETVYHCDFSLPSDNPLTGQTIEEIAQFADFWGQGLDEPVVCITNVPIVKGSVFLYRKQTGDSIKIIADGIEYFKKPASVEEYETLTFKGDTSEVPKMYYATIVGKCTMNEWNGRSKPEIKVIDYELSPPQYDI